MLDNEKNLAYLSLGSNIVPELNLPAAVVRLAHFGRVKAVSSVYETAPVGRAKLARIQDGGKINRSMRRQEFISGCLIA